MATVLWHFINHISFLKINVVNVVICEPVFYRINFKIKLRALRYAAGKF